MRRTRGLHLTCLFVAALSLPANAQNVEHARTGTFVGYAVDSVHGGFLRGATVTVSNSALAATTDSLGRFQIDDVIPGMHSLRLSHPLLDTLGLGVTTPPISVTPGSSTAVVLAVPSPATIVGRRCSSAELKSGGGALAGVVDEADTQLPAANAEVIVAWTDYQVGAKSVVSTPQRRTALVRPDGTFLVCGIPTDLVTGVVAHRGADSTAAIPTSFARGLALQSFHVPEPMSPVAPASNAGATSGGPRRLGVIRGVVTDASDHPLSGARIAVEEDTAAAISQADGHYSLSGLRAGTRRVTVRHIGFEPIEMPVNLKPSIPMELPLKLSKFVPVLETVKVSALRDLGLERVGFASRQKLGSGKYLTPQQLDRWNSPRLADALRGIPFLNIGRSNDGQTTVRGRFGDCVRYFVDGHLWSDHSDGPDTFLSGPEIGAIEVYTPQFSPAEFLSYDYYGRPCASVVVWTKWKLRIN
jgi:carboxypeptidase family protein